MDELEKLIKFIDDTYNKINNKWMINKNFTEINMSKIRVENVFENEYLLFNIFNYRIL